MRNTQEESLLMQAEEIIEKKIRPALAGHSGDIEIVSFEEGILRIRLLGQCCHCPSAKTTVEEIVAGPLQKNLPEIREVVLESSVSDGLLDFARSLMGHRER